MAVRRQRVNLIPMHATMRRGARGWMVCVNYLLLLWKPLPLLHMQGVGLISALGNQFQRDLDFLLKFCCLGINSAFPRAEKSVAMCGDYDDGEGGAGLSVFVFCCRHQGWTCANKWKERHSVTTFRRWKLTIGVCLLSVSLPDANFRAFKPQ